MVDVLRLALEEMGVEIRTSFEVTALKRGKKGGFQVLSRRRPSTPMPLSSAVAAWQAGGKLGGTQSGYDLLKSQGHTMPSCSLRWCR